MDGNNATTNANDISIDNGGGAIGKGSPSKDEGAKDAS